MAISRFFANFVLHPDYYETDGGYLAELPAMYSQSASGSALQLAVQSCALTSFTDATADRTLRMAAHEAHGQALQAIKVAISDASIAKHDATLMAMLTLDFCGV